ncbi:MAG: Snf7 family protein, partial [Candidatus Heimdallarchaeota archaeon]
ETARLFAKDMARSRKMALNLQRLRSRVKTMTFKLEHASTVQQIGMDLRGLVKSLHQVNRHIQVSGMEQLLFTMENEMENLSLTTETLEEGFDSISFEGEGEDDEADKILEEMKATRVAQTASSLASGSDSMSEDIEERLKKLKGEEGDS